MQIPLTSPFKTNKPLDRASERSGLQIHEWWERYPREAPPAIRAIRPTAKMSGFHPEDAGAAPASHTTLSLQPESHPVGPSICYLLAAAARELHAPWEGEIAFNAVIVQWFVLVQVGGG